MGGSLDDAAHGLFGYLASQEQNLLVSLQRFRQEFDLFGSVDLLYRQTLANLANGKNNLKLGDVGLSQLFVFEHNHFYLGMSLLLRTHISDGYHSVRTAIDAALVSYRIILKDGTFDDYVNRANSFTAVPRYVRRKRSANETSYPLAGPLLKLYAYCSQFASHADFRVFVDRLRLQEDGNKQLIQVGYFQQNPSTPMHQMFLLTFLDAHICILGIYESFLIEKGIVDQNWISTRHQIGLTVANAKQQIRNVMEKETLASQ